MKIFADEKWAVYVLRVFLSTFNIKNNDYTISYGKDISKDGIVIFKGNKSDKKLIYKNEIIPIYYTSTNNKNLGESLYFFDDEKPAILYNIKSNKIYFNFDLIKASYIFLSRIIERETPKDDFGRFQAKFSKNQNIGYPIVNEYFQILYDIVLRLSNKSQENQKNEVIWPNNAPYAVCLTHDVDYVYKWWIRKLISKLFKTREYKEVVGSIGKGEYRNFDKIMKIEEKFGFRSTFFFLSFKRDIELGYNVKKLKNEINALNENGWEIGLHAGLNSYNDYNQLLREKQQLEKVVGEKIVGIRNHYLRLDIPDTWNIQRKMGFIYDSTLGFRERAGFRPCYCYPFFPYDFHNDKIIDIIELPMAIMDNALFMNSNPFSRFEDIIDMVKRFEGLLVINWHQRAFDQKEFPDYIILYNKILEKIKQDNAFVGTCKDISHIWKNHYEKKVEVI